MKAQDCIVSSSLVEKAQDCIVSSSLVEKAQDFVLSSSLAEKAQDYIVSSSLVEKAQDCVLSSSLTERKLTEHVILLAEKTAKPVKNSPGSCDESKIIYKNGWSTSAKGRHTAYIFFTTHKCDAITSLSHCGLILA